MGKFLNVLGCVGLGGAAFLVANDEAREKVMTLGGDALEKAKSIFDKKEVSTESDLSDEAATSVESTSED